jgi:hypothetical protein
MSCGVINARLFKSVPACQIPGARHNEGSKMTRRLLACVAVLAVALPGAALAGHGKAGLWKITSSTQMNMAMPQGMGAGGTPMTMPSTSHTTHMCMSQEEVDSSSPPHIDESSTGCATRLISATAASMKAAMICDGRLKGTGDMQISYSGAEHYRGTYSFKGQVEGNPTTMTTRFQGDWVKTDCGAVKPYKLRTQ